ncbi:MAG: alanine racemase [Clostridiales bacterium]|nr:alanine racemase [Clostridiales bacterium]
MREKKYFETMDRNGFKTPCYLFDETECISRVQEIRQQLSAWGGKVCYAIKANPFLIPSLLHVVDKFEVCSPGELEICRRYGVPGSKILFSGVVKTRENIEKALAYPVEVITLESLTHWRLLKECLGEHVEGMDVSRTIKVMPRLSSGAQFGMEERELLQVIEEQQSMENICVEGIHYFTGTQKKGNKYEKEIETAAELIRKLKEEYGLESLILEYGPGFAVPYFQGDDFSAPFGLVQQMKEYIVERKFPFRIDIELGRYIAASCGKYFTSIVDIKSAGERNYCLVDGGIHHVNYYGSNMAMRTPSIVHEKRNEDSGQTPGDVHQKEYMICGALCTFADILVRGLALTEPAIGDVLIFENIGAYSVTEGNYLFLSRDLPEIYLKKQDGSIEKLRAGSPSYPINSCD